MQLKLRNLTVFVSLLCLLQVIAYGTQITLNYDGETHIYDKAPISLYVNNEFVEPSIMPPVQVSGYVLVPTREVFNAMGAMVQWKGVEKKVYIEQQDSLIVLELDNTKAWVNGEIKIMDMAPKIINDKIMVPIRFISETLGFQVDWLGAERCIYISKVENSHNKEDESINKNEVVNQNNSELENEKNNMIEFPQENYQDDLGEEILDYNKECNDLSKIFPMLAYDVVTQTMTISASVKESDILIDDIYTKRKIVFYLNHCSDMPEGVWQGDLGYLKSVTILNNSAGMQLVVETNTICATEILDTEEGIAVKFMKPKEKYDKLIVVDAGHGGADDGTSYDGILEKDLTLKYGKALYDKLEKDQSIKVYATRPQDTYATENDGIIGKQYPTLDMRVAISNEIEPDLYISVHVNSVENEKANGIETYYYPVASDTRGKTFAGMVQTALVNEFGMNDRKAKTAEFQVIKYTNDPAILIETGFITNSADRIILTSPDYANRFAQTIYGCIKDYYEKGLK